MAVSLNGLYKAELIWQQGLWRNVEHVDLATLLWFEWFNHRRLHGELTQPSSLYTGSRPTSPKPRSDWTTKRYSYFPIVKRGDF